MDEPRFSIGEAAKLCGINISTLRFWEERGLLHPLRSKGKFRLYSRSELQRIENIKEMTSRRGVSLRAAAELLERGEPAGLSRSERDQEGTHQVGAGSFGGRMPLQHEWMQRSLGRATEQLLSSLDLDDVLSQIVISAGHFLDMENATVVMVGDLAALGRPAGPMPPKADGDELEVLPPPNLKVRRCDSSSRQFSGDGVHSDEPTALDAAVYRLAEMECEPVVITRSRGHELVPAEALPHDAGLLLVIPLWHGRRPVGAIYLTDSDEGRHVDKEELKLAANLGHNSAIAIDNAGVVARLRGSEANYREEKARDGQIQRQQRTIETIERVAYLVAQPFSRAEVLHGILDELLALSGFDMGYFFLLDEGTGELRLEAQRGMPEDIVRDSQRWKLGTSLSGRVAVTGDPLLVENLSEDHRITAASIRRSGLRAWIGVPLKCRDKVFGTLSLASRAERKATKEDVDLLVTIGYLAAGLVERSQLEEVAIYTPGKGANTFAGRLSQITSVQRRERWRIARQVQRSIVGSLRDVAGDMQSQADLGGISSFVARRYIKQLQSTLQCAGQLASDLKGSSVAERTLATVLNEDLLVPMRELDSCSAFLEAKEWPEALPSDVSFHLYRIAQEALSNVCRHARAGSVCVSLTGERERLCLEIRDDGIGFQEQEVFARMPGGDIYGLVTMWEHALILGGQLSVNSKPARGTTIRVVVPRNQDLWIEAPVRVLVAGSNVLFNKVIASLLAGEAGITVVAQTTDGASTIEAGGELSPDVVLLDSALSDMSGVEVTRSIRLARPETKIVLFSGTDLDRTILDGLGAGATGFLSKIAQPQEIVNAVLAAKRGEYVLGPQVLRHLIHALTALSETEEQRVLFDGLTPRELEILRLLTSGKASKEIAYELEISGKTVRHHISSIYRKVNVYDRAQLVLYALRKGLLDLGEQGHESRKVTFLMRQFAALQSELLAATMR